MTRFQVIPAAYLLLTRGSGDELEVLLQLRGPGTSYLPGHWASGAAGHVEHGESVFVAAAREASEELGVAVEPADITPLCAVQRTLPGCDDPVEQRADYFLTTRRWAGEPTIQEPAKCVELRWCRPYALPEPMVPHERVVLALLAGGAVPPIISIGFRAAPAGGPVCRSDHRARVQGGPAHGRPSEGVEMSTDPSDPLAPSTEPEVLPSSTPDGPQTIPTPSPDEPSPQAQPGQLDEATRGSNPSSGGPAGLSGDLGISSERTEPAGPDPRGSDIAGTGSAGGSVNRTDGGNDTTPTTFDAPDVSQRDVNPMPEGAETMTGAGNTPMGQGNPGDIDRTVGEPMPNPIPDEKLRRGNQSDVSRAK